MPKDMHDISKRTRNEIWRIIHKHDLCEDLLYSYGMIDRIIRASKLVHEGGVIKMWAPDPLRFGAVEWPIMTEIRSSEGPKIVGVVLAPVKDEPLLGRKDGEMLYEITSAGEDYSYRCTHIGAHTCKDSFFQEGLKKLPIRCKHTIAACMYVPAKLNEQAMDGKSPNIRVLERYSEVGEDLESFYDELGRHSLTAAQKLDVLYRFAKGEIGRYEFGRGFKKSIGL